MILIIITIVIHIQVDPGQAGRRKFPGLRIVKL